MNDINETSKAKVGQSIYLVFESNHGDFACDGVGVEVKGAFLRKEKAVDCANNLLKEWRDDPDFAVESEFTEFQVEDVGEMRPSEISCEVYKGYQSNWSAYFDLSLMKLELE